MECNGEVNDCLSSGILVTLSVIAELAETDPTAAIKMCHEACEHFAAIDVPKPIWTLHAVMLAHATMMKGGVSISNARFDA